MILAVLAALIVLNVYSFLLMLKDKRAAKRGEWRVPEKKLFIAAACFGALGGVLGMNLLRHKTKHWYFKLGFPLIAAAQLALLIYFNV